jgi:hypothetical protein
LLNEECGPLPTTSAERASQFGRPAVNGILAGVWARGDTRHPLFLVMGALAAIIFAFAVAPLIHVLQKPLDLARRDHSSEASRQSPDLAGVDHSSWPRRLG